MHVPVEQARKARAVAAERGADCALAIGGGRRSVSARRLRWSPRCRLSLCPPPTPAPKPTPIYGLTDAGSNAPDAMPVSCPRTVIYDPELSLRLPRMVSVTSGINAIAHVAEGLYAGDRNPVSDWMSREGIAALGRALPIIAREGRENDAERLVARGDALYGAWLCGAVLGSVTADCTTSCVVRWVAPSTCRMRGKYRHTDRAALAYNAPAAPAAMEAIAGALGASDGNAPAAASTSPPRSAPYRVARHRPEGSGSGAGMRTGPAGSRTRIRACWKRLASAPSCATRSWAVVRRFKTIR